MTTLSKLSDINNWSVIQLITEILAFETVAPQLKNIEYSQEQAQAIQDKISKMFEAQYDLPPEGILSILTDTIQILNFCG